MNSGDEQTTAHTAATGQERTEQQQASNISPSPVNKTEHEIQHPKTDVVEVSAHNSSKTAESCSDDDSRKLEATSSAGPHSSTVLATGSEILCQGKVKETSLISLSSHMGSENKCDDTKVEMQALRCMISLQPVAEAMENLGKATEHGLDSTATTLPSNVATLTKEVPSTCEIQNRETGATGAEPITFFTSSSSREVVKTMDSERVLSSQKIAPCEMSQTTSDTARSVVCSLKVLAGEKIVNPASGSDTSCVKVMNQSKENQGTSVDITKSKTGSDDITKSKTDSDVISHGETDASALPTAKQPGEKKTGDNNEKKAYFYISSCGVAGEGSEWPTISDGYQLPSERPGRRIVRPDSNEPSRRLGSQVCQYFVVAIALLTTLIGCIACHLGNLGIGPEVLRPMGASTAFLSFAVCVFSTIYISYLRNYPQLPVIPNYEMLGDADSVMAMNRASKPEFNMTDEGHYTSGSRIAASDYYIGETQYADVLDRRGYGKQSEGCQQVEVKRCSDEPGTVYTTQPPKRFKAESSVVTAHVSEWELKTPADDQTGAESNVVTSYVSEWELKTPADDQTDNRQGTSQTQETEEQATDIPQQSSDKLAEVPPDCNISEKCHASDVRPLLT